MKDLIPHENVHELIYLIRGQKVMLDADLADLYGVETFNLNKAVKRNPTVFPMIIPAYPEPAAATGEGPNRVQGASRLRTISAISLKGSVAGIST